MKAIFISVMLLSVSMAKAQTGETLLVYFDFGKYELTEKAKMEIDSFFSVQQAFVTKVELSGHCDFIGSDGYNDILSSRRVNKVKALLQARNYVKPDIITTVAYGEKKPLNENKTDEDRQLNRRVEILITTMVSEGADTTPETAVPLKEKIADSATVPGTNIVLRHINFFGGMHRLLPESAPTLQELLDAMKTYPNLVIEIQGHICCQPGTGDGMDRETRIYNLSAARAKAIYDHLIANGIQPSRISYKGFGHTQPVYPYPEQTEEQREANRRVEIKIISK